MKASEFLQVAGRVVVALAGVGAVVAGVGLRSCAQSKPTAYLESTGAADTTWRFAALGRVLLAKPKPAPLPASPRYGRAAWQLAKVVRVVDGDTYDVLVNGATPARVQLLAVDAPEHDQPGGQLATDSVCKVVLGKMVLLLSAGGDLYGRTLAQVRLRPAAFSTQPGLALDSLMVARGWAWAFDPDHAVPALAAQQVAAQAAGRGLWKCGTTGPVAPKTWRKMSQAAKARAWVGCPW